MTGIVCNGDVRYGPQHAGQNRPVHQHSEVRRTGFPLGRFHFLFYNQYTDGISAGSLESMSAVPVYCDPD